MGSWIFFGMAWLALLINHSIDILEQLNSLLKKGCCGEKSKEESGNADENNPDTQVEDENDFKKPPIT